MNKLLSILMAITCSACSSQMPLAENLSSKQNSNLIAKPSIATPSIVSDLNLSEKKSLDTPRDGKVIVADAGTLQTSEMNKPVVINNTFSPQNSTSNAGSTPSEMNRNRTESNEREKKWSYRDTTMETPNMYFEETPLSKSVIVGSRYYADIANCHIMQRYKISTNADFTSSMNLFKYRAAMMGAERVTVVHHSEIDAKETNKIDDNEKIYIRAGTKLEESSFYTTIVGDIYDCPCSQNTCLNK